MNFSKLIARARQILLTPKTEWPVIAAEPDTTAGIYRNYILILAALAPLAGFIKASVIGYQVPLLGAFRVDMGMGLVAMLVSYGLSLVAVYVFALIINALAPSFGSQKDALLAFKTAAYSITAAWVAGISQLLPPVLSMLIMLAGGIYCVYLLYLALPTTMKCPPDKAVAYTAVSVIAGILLAWLVAAIAGSVIGRSLWTGGFGGGMGVPATTPQGSFDKDSPLGQLEEWNKKVEEAGKQVESSANAGGGVPTSAAVGQMMGAVMGGGSNVEALAPDRMKAFLPESLLGRPRSDMSVERNAAMGIQVSEARASYPDEQGRTLNLELTDTRGVKGLVSLASWAAVEQEREWSGGYERTYRQDGRMVHERWDEQSGSGEFGVIVADRFSVTVSSPAAGMDELRAALGGVDLAGLEALRNEGVKQN